MELLNKLVVILGPTAVGKTKLAVHLAKELNGEIISADSRQVYRKMDIGTGKDLADFTIDDQVIQHHLIDIKDPGDEYDVFEFQQDFLAAYDTLIKNDKIPILCGGTGMYLQAALQPELMLKVPHNKKLREELYALNQLELNDMLKKMKSNVHNQTDLNDRERTIRAIEIEKYKQVSQKELNPIKQYVIFGIQIDRSILRHQIKLRLDSRLNEGMIDEVAQLIADGISIEKLTYYGLEYKFIALYLNKEISYTQMYDDLLQAIRRFAKKQMTWYRRMEKMGYVINWIEAEIPLEKKLNIIKQKLNEKL
ncbi:MAG: tRNA (adenosine(37)-N6)-dimethylallyltransferase MiaA [Bacteroidetes bacterium]|nr:MAG: tRNA (adenosine(37)-N6)-dimethylallyltransferase MiaA [Bacteroidota bacterium]MBL1146000.1 tRNA (adenosine(37)-N6)-dimethylallyltransferase MiaA [Bacteroidota bacterium]MCB0802097.1 tRNA (adenosine(37)-N6)-dimethylallyltransferase MiaA [Flavobacteriales bacterium]NOG58794.1 tRNA (adenosine(37)-N6)-dimethylallyltransferase MiaA [Bacteroidota bacterium]